jgi:hypothetical protein
MHLLQKVRSEMKDKQNKEEKNIYGFKKNK